MNDYWLIYSAGGGYGHCMRAMALARCAVKKCKTRKVTVIGNQTSLQKIMNVNDSSRIRLLGLDDRLDKANFKKHVSRTFDGLLRSEPSSRTGAFSHLIVDTFPRGIVGELQTLPKPLGTKTIFVHRDIEPDYIKHDRVRQAVERFDMVLVPGESPPLANHSKAVQTNPWVLLDSDDLLSREQSRMELKCSSKSNPVCLVSLSGKPDERILFSNIACQLISRFGNQCEIRVCGDIPPELETHLADHAINYWPIMRILPGVDFIVGAGGYNTFHESRFAQTTLYSLPQKRLYDRQNKRVSTVNSYSSPEQLLNAIGSRLSNTKPFPVRTAPVGYTNGVHAAVTAIESLNTD